MADHIDGVDDEADEAHSHAFHALEHVVAHMLGAPIADAMTHFGASPAGATPHVFGTPHADTAYYHHQNADFTCALVAQIGILQEYTGLDYEECKAAVEASQFKLIDTHGTTPENVGGWLELHGIPCHTNAHASLGDMLRELSAGHKVIVGVNSDGLWNSSGAMHDFGGHAVDHAIWLTGVDFSDSDHPKVIINDSGDPNGAGRTYELNEFVNAASNAQSSGMFYVATDSAPPHLEDRLDGYDASVGCVPQLTQFVHDHERELGLGAAALASGVLMGVPASPANQPPTIEEVELRRGAESAMARARSDSQSAAKGDPGTARQAVTPRYADLTPEQRDRLLDSSL